MKKYLITLIIVILSFTSTQASTLISFAVNDDVINVQHADGYTAYITSDIKEMDKSQPIKISDIQGMMRLGSIKSHKLDDNYDIKVNRSGLYSIIITNGDKVVQFKQVYVQLPELVAEVETAIEVNASELPVITSTLTTKHQLTYYLRDEEHIEVNNDEIIELSKFITDNAKDKSKAIFKWITENIEYDYTKLSDAKIGKSYGAVHTLATDKGICYDMACLFTALARASHIPSTVVCGTYDGGYHAWALAYIDNEWVTVDPTMKNYNTNVDKYVSFGEYRLLK